MDSYGLLKWCQYICHAKKEKQVNSNNMSQESQNQN
jgi:hypothetical protein